MRDDGALRHVVPPVVVTFAQEEICRKKRVWTTGAVRFIIGFTKEVTSDARPLKACFAIVFLLIAVRMDLSSERIKNRWILIGLAAGMVFWIPDASLESGKDLLAGILLPIIICWIPFLMHALGAGDIKLFSVIGCLYGGRDAVFCIGYSFLTAAAFSVWKMIRNRRLRTSLINGFQYFQQIFHEGTIMAYPGRDDPQQRIHFSLSVIIGFAVLLGVKLCRNVRLY